MADLSALRAKLRALKSKTVQNGCTEAESLAAAEKAAELLSRHGLAEADLFGEQYEEADVPAGRRSPLYQVWLAIGLFADCKGWFDKRENGPRFVYFGRDGDVLVAQYIHEIMVRACAKATADFRQSPLYKSRRKPRTRAAAVRAFQEALATSLVTKLNDGLWRRYRTNCGASAKEALRLTITTLDEKATAAGYRFRNLRALAPAEGGFKREAHHHGFAAGDKIEINAGVAAGNKISGVLQ